MSGKKKELGYPQEQLPLIIMDTFKVKDNNEMKRLSTKNNCELVIVSQNLSNKFQPLDISKIRQQKNSLTNTAHGMLIECANNCPMGLRLGKSISSIVRCETPSNQEDCIGSQNTKPFHNQRF